MAAIKAFVLAVARTLAGKVLAGHYPAIEGLAVFGSFHSEHYVAAEFDRLAVVAKGAGPTRAAALRDLADRLDAAAPK